MFVGTRLCSPGSSQGFPPSEETLQLLNHYRLNHPLINVLTYYICGDIYVKEVYGNADTWIEIVFKTP